MTSLPAASEALSPTPGEKIQDMAELKNYLDTKCKDRAFRLPEPFVTAYMQHLVETGKHYATDHAGLFIAGHEGGDDRVPLLPDGVEPAIYFASINDLGRVLNQQALDLEYEKDPDRPVVYVVGGPGSGKTTLIAKWDEADKTGKIISENAFLGHKKMNDFIVPLLGDTRKITVIRLFCSPVLGAQGMVDRAMMGKDAGITGDERLFKSFKKGPYTPSLKDAKDWSSAREMNIEIYQRTKEGVIKVESLEQLPQSWEAFIPEWEEYLGEVEADAVTWTSETLQNSIADLKERTFGNEGDLVTAVLELKLAHYEAQGKDVAWARKALALGPVSKP